MVQRKRLMQCVVGGVASVALLAVGLTVPANADDGDNGSESEVYTAADYFESKGSTYAYTILTDSTATTYYDVDLDSEDDAASWDNFIAAIEFIEESNKYRTDNGLDPLQISDALMAQAMVQADYLDQSFRHNKQFSSLTEGENIAVAVSSSSDLEETYDPFGGWYVDEKSYFDDACQELYGETVDPIDAYEFYHSGDHESEIEGYISEKYGSSEEAGHYINIVNPSFTVTGFGVAQAPYQTLYGEWCAQEFANESYYASAASTTYDESSGTLYDVSDYLTSVEDFQNNAGTETATSYTVTFDSNGGSAVDSATVNDGEAVSEPEAPTRDGYTFAGWTLNGESYDFSTPVTSDITLVASWVEDTEPTVTHTVTFDSDGGSTVDSVTVNDGDAVTKPDDPTKDGYTFNGWFLGDEEYDFSTPVTSDITLTASWTEDEGTSTTPSEGEETPVTIHTVTFDTDGGSSIDPVTVNDGDVVSEPEAPTKDGYTFVGWLLDGEEYDFSTPVTSDITLTASWTETGEGEDTAGGSSDEETTGGSSEDSADTGDGAGSDEGGDESASGVESDDDDTDDDASVSEPAITDSDEGEEELQSDESEDTDEPEDSDESEGDENTESAAESESSESSSSLAQTGAAIGVAVVVAVVLAAAGVLLIRWRRRA